MSSRVFRNELPQRSHLLRGRGVNGEVADLRHDTDESFAQLEVEGILDIQFSFTGAAPPAGGANTGLYGFCHTAGGTYLAGDVVFDNGCHLEVLTKKGLLISPRVDVVGAVSLTANCIYYETAAAAPYTWVAKGGSAGSTGVNVYDEGTLVLAAATDLNFKGSVTVVDAGAGTVDINVVGSGGGVGHLTQTFDWTDVAGGEIAVGVAPLGTMVQSVLLTILDDFDGGVSIEVGSDAAPAQLMLGAENIPSLVESYISFVDVLYVADTTVKVFFTAGTPTQGSGKVTVFLS